MELYIYNRNLEFQGIIDNFHSLRWTRKYYSSGEFELQCPRTSSNFNLLKKENIIYKKGDNEAGCIEFISLKQDTNGKEILSVKGRFLTGYLNRRIVWGTEIINDTVENAMRTLVTNNAINPTNTDRIISNLGLGILNNFTQNVDYQVSYKNLGEEIAKLSNTSNLGHRITFDINNKKLIFDIYEGLDRSVNQSINSICVFAKEFENILEQEYVNSIYNYKNLCLVGGVGEGVARKLVTLGESSGLDRFEIFEDQKNLSNEIDGIAMSDEDYNNLLLEKGNESLSTCKEVQTFDSIINSNSNLIYKVDYDLGDVVTCISKAWELTIDTRITEIEEIYEEQGQQINITFGNNIPTLLDIIKKIERS
jgi:hypothetical protein